MGTEEVEREARAIHEAPGECIVCYDVTAPISNKPSWQELFGNSRERHRAVVKYRLGFVDKPALAALTIRFTLAGDVSYVEGDEKITLVSWCGLASQLSRLTIVRDDGAEPLLILEATTYYPNAQWRGDDLFLRGRLRFSSTRGGVFKINDRYVVGLQDPGR